MAILPNDFSKDINDLFNEISRSGDSVKEYFDAIKNRELGKKLEKVARKQSRKQMDKYGKKGLGLATARNAKLASGVSAVLVGMSLMLSTQSNMKFYIRYEQQIREYRERQRDRLPPQDYYDRVGAERPSMDDNDGRPAWERDVGDNGSNSGNRPPAGENGSGRPPAGDYDGDRPTGGPTARLDGIYLYPPGIYTQGLEPLGRVEIRNGIFSWTYLGELFLSGPYTLEGDVFNITAQSGGAPDGLEDWGWTFRLEGGNIWLDRSEFSDEYMKQ